MTTPAPLSHLIEHLDLLGAASTAAEWSPVRSDQNSSEFYHPVHGYHRVEGVSAGYLVSSVLKDEQAIEARRAQSISPDVEKVLSAHWDVQRGVGANWRHSLKEKTLEKMTRSPVFMACKSDIPKAFCFFFPEGKSNPLTLKATDDMSGVLFSIEPMSPHKSGTADILQSLLSAHPVFKMFVEDEFEDRSGPETTFQLHPYQLSMKSRTVAEVIQSLRELGLTYDHQRCLTAGAAPKNLPAPVQAPVMDMSHPPTPNDAKILAAQLAVNAQDILGSDRARDWPANHPRVQHALSLMDTPEWAWCLPEIRKLISFHILEDEDECYTGSHAEEMIVMIETKHLPIDPRVLDKMGFMSTELGAACDVDEYGDDAYHIAHQGSGQSFISAMIALGCVHDAASCALSSSPTTTTSTSAPAYVAPAPPPPPPPSPTEQGPHADAFDAIKKGNARRLDQMLKNGLSADATSAGDDDDDDDYNHGVSLLRYALDQGDAECFAVLLDNGADAMEHNPDNATGCDGILSAMLGRGHTLARSYSAFVKPWVSHLGPDLTVPVAAQIIAWSMGVPQAKVNIRERDAMRSDLQALMTPKDWQAAVIMATAAEPKGWLVTPWSTDAASILSNDPAILSRKTHLGGEAPIDVALSSSAFGAIREMVKKSNLPPSKIITSKGSLLHVAHTLLNQATTGKTSSDGDDFLNSLSAGSIPQFGPRRSFSSCFGPHGKAELNQIKMFAQSMDMMEAIAQRAISKPPVKKMGP